MAFVNHLTIFLQRQDGKGGHQLRGPRLLLQAPRQGDGGQVQEGGEAEVRRGLLLGGQQLWIPREELEGEEGGGAARLLGVCAVRQEVAHGGRALGASLQVKARKSNCHYNPGTQILL